MWVGLNNAFIFFRRPQPLPRLSVITLFYALQRLAQVGTFLIPRPSERLRLIRFAPSHKRGGKFVEEKQRCAHHSLAVGKRGVGAAEKHFGRNHHIGAHGLQALADVQAAVDAAVAAGAKR